MALKLSMSSCRRILLNNTPKKTNPSQSRLLNAKNIRPSSSFPLSQTFFCLTKVWNISHTKPFSSNNDKPRAALQLVCWKCQKTINPETELSYLLCPSCGSPQKLGSTQDLNYFTLLEQPQSYQVDLDKLSQTAKRLQKKYHPDLFAQRGKEEQELSQDLSSLINKAVSTLSNPIERGRYLLQLNGVVDPVGDIEKEVTNEPLFLEQVMELNERLEELSSEQDWLQFRADNEVTLKGLQRELHKAFKCGKIEEAKVLLARMKYFDTLQGKLKELKTKLNIVE